MEHPDVRLDVWPMPSMNVTGAVPGKTHTCRRLGMASRSAPPTRLRPWIVIDRGAATIAAYVLVDANPGVEVRPSPRRHSMYVSIGMSG